MLLLVLIMFHVFFYTVARPPTSDTGDHSQPRPSVSWTDLMSGHVEVETEEAAPPLHPDFCGTRPGLAAADTGGPDSRIVGGAAARWGEVPWQAALVRAGHGHQIVCGAAVVSSRHVLTAAHCLKLAPASYRVVVGSLARVPGPGRGQELRVVRAVTHPAFSPRSLQQDLAVLRLETSWGQGLAFSPWVVPACLPRPAQPGLYTPGTRGLVSGWGVLAENSTALSDSLQVASLGLVSQQTCAASYSEVTSISSDQFCAGSEDAALARDACAGDSGGPLAVLEAGRWHLAGLVSFGLGCGRAEHPGVYTRLDTALAWILDTMDTMDSGDSGVEGARDFQQTTTTTSSTTSTTTTAASARQYFVTGMCERTQKYIWCNYGSKISLTDTFYGVTAGEARCGAPAPAADCSLSSAAALLAAACEGRRTCHVSPARLFPAPYCAAPPHLSFKFSCRDTMARTMAGGVEEENRDVYDLIHHVP